MPFTINNKSPFLTYSVNVVGMPPRTFANFTNDGFVLRFNKTFSGWVELFVTAFNNCGTISAFSEAHIDDCSFIPHGNARQELEKPLSVFQVYPNPSDDIVYLNMVDAANNPAKNTIINAVLFDMLGFEKEKLQLKDNNAFIDVRGLASGLYVLRITIGDKIETHLISVK